MNHEEKLLQKEERRKMERKEEDEEEEVAGDTTAHPSPESASKMRTLKQKVGFEASETRTLRQKVRQKHVPLGKKSGPRCGPGDIKDTSGFE